LLLIALPARLLLLLLLLHFLLIEAHPARSRHKLHLLDPAPTSTILNSPSKRNYLWRTELCH